MCGFGVTIVAELRAKMENDAVAVAELRNRIVELENKGKRVHIVGLYLYVNTAVLHTGKS